MSPLWWGVWGGGLRGPQIWGGGLGVLGLGVLMRGGVWGWGLQDPRVWDGMGGLGAGCLHWGGECGVGV